MFLLRRPNFKKEGSFHSFKQHMVSVLRWVDTSPSCCNYKLSTQSNSGV